MNIDEKAAKIKRYMDEVFDDTDVIEIAKKLNLNDEASIHFIEGFLCGMDLAHITMHKHTGYHVQDFDCPLCDDCSTCRNSGKLDNYVATECKTCLDFSNWISK